MLYITVGNPSPDLDGAIRQGDNLFSESIVALDVRTGQRKWHFQQVRHDIWDYDTVSPNILFEADVGGRRVKGLAQAGKTGWVYLLDRETGKPLLNIPDKAVPQNANQKTAAMQPYPDGDPFVPLACTEPVGSYPMGGIFTPFEQDPMLICPGANGGSEWTDQSFNPQTNLMYVCGIHQPQIWTAKPEKLEQGTLRLGSAFVTPPGGKTWGTLTAMDVRTNKIAWQKSGDKDEDFKQMCIGGTMTTAGGLVFAGEGNGSFNAYDARTGNRLWQFQTDAGLNAPAMTYEVDGDQYVAVASGGNFQLNFPRGDTLWVFSLKGSMGPVAAPPIPNPVQQQQALAVNNPRMVDFGYEPGWILVPPGTTVTWTQTGDQPHSATSDQPGVFDSGILNKGQTYSHQFNDEGSFDYFCIPHPFMRGKVIVDNNAPQPVQQPPPAPAPRQGEAEPKAPAGGPTATPAATPRP
jgi:glucose dehydrogenase